MINQKYLKLFGATALLVLVTGCKSQAAPSSPKPHESLPTVTVHEAAGSALSELPVTVAQKLGFAADEHIHITLTSAAKAEVTVGPLTPDGPIVGYVTTRPDMLLMSPVPDPHFRLSALNHLPMVYTRTLVSEKAWADAVMARQRITITTWQAMPFSEVTQLWQRHHLPWVLVTLQEALQLRRLDKGSTTLAWLGASTGSVPAMAIRARQTSPQVVQFLKALNLALWYLHTTPPSTIAKALDPTHPKRWAHAVETALHYQYWPATTYPDEASYARSRALLGPAWPAYQTLVNPLLAGQALNDAAGT